MFVPLVITLAALVMIVVVALLVATDGVGRGSPFGGFKAKVLWLTEALATQLRAYFP